MKKFLMIAILFLSFFLNFYQLDKIPPGLYIDEASIGVNAYSILKTGKDEHGEKFPLYFKAFGEYKLPVYIYLTSAAIFFFGKNEFAIRFPSAFFGSLTIIIFFFLVKELSKDTRFSLLSTMLLTTNPWFLQFVGPAFEANLAMFLFLLASWLFLLYWKRNNVLYFLGSLSFYFLTIHTYNSYKIITPIIVFVFLMKNNLFYAIIILFFLFTLPSLMMFEGRTRFLQTSFLNQVTFDNIYVIIPSYLTVFIRNYLSYFSFDFLFNMGDGIGRHQMPNFGLISRWQLPFLIAGFYYLLKKITLPAHKIIFFLLFLIPVPAALTLPSPHSLRSLLLVIPLITIIAYTITYIFQKASKILLLFTLVITLIFTYEFSYYLHYYFFHYPKTNLMDWGANYKELVDKTSKYQNNYPTIAINENLTQAYIYFKFYNPKISLMMVNSSWNKRGDFGNQPVLYITRFIDEKSGKPSDKLLESVYLPNDNKDGFAQFWEI